MQAYKALKAFEKIVVENSGVDKVVINIKADIWQAGYPNAFIKSKTETHAYYQGSKLKAVFSITNPYIKPSLKKAWESYIISKGVTDPSFSKEYSFSDYNKLYKRGFFNIFETPSSFTPTNGAASFYDIKQYISSKITKPLTREGMKLSKPCYDFSIVLPHLLECNIQTNQSGKVTAIGVGLNQSKYKVDTLILED